MDVPSSTAGSKALEIRRNMGRWFKCGPEPSNFEDLCLVNVSVKYLSKLCFGTIKIQPELKYLRTILEVFTSWFQRAKAMEHEFGCVPSISSIFTGSKMAGICQGMNTNILKNYNVKVVQWSEDLFFSSRSWVHNRSTFLGFDRKIT